MVRENRGVWLWSPGLVATGDAQRALRVAKPAVRLNSFRWDPGAWGSCSHLSGCRYMAL